MENIKTLPCGISVVYFNDESKSIYADMPPDKEQAKRLSRRTFRNAMTAISTERKKTDILLQVIYENSGIST